MAGWSSTASAQVRLQNPGAPPSGAGEVAGELAVPTPLEEALGIFRLDEAALRAIVVPEALRSIVTRLGAKEWLIRREASLELEGMKPEPEILVRLLIDPELDLEQRARLLRCLVGRIVQMPRGAVGIRMSTNLQRNGVLVSAVIPGLPAEAFLEVGDLIVSIEDTPINNSEDLISVVQSRKPGDRLAFLVRRPKRGGQGVDELGPDGRPVTELLEFVIPLGSVAELDQTGNVASSARLDEVRKRKIRVVQEAFGPKPVRVRTPSVIIAEAPFVDRPADSHPAVVWLLQNRQILDAGGDPFTPDFEKRVAKFRRDMTTAVRDVDLTEAEQAWHRRSLDRFEGLLESF